MKNYIHPTSIIETVEIGYGNYIGPYCVLKNCTIGNNNRFEAFCSVGTPPEHKTATENKQVIIGNDNVFKEFITINCGTERETTIGNGVWMLTKSHAGHDAIIHDDVTISCYACVGGHSEIWNYTNLGLHSVVHQNVTVPPGVMLGMGGVVSKGNVLRPFYKFVGVPVKPLLENAVLKEKLGTEKVKQLIEKYENSLLNAHA